MEYIERDAAIAAAFSATSLGNSAFRDVYDTVSRLRLIPAADVRPVVTCGECEYCIKKDEHELLCNGFCNPAKLVRKDDFCSHGSRHE